MILIDSEKEINAMNIFPTGFFERLLTFCKGKYNFRVGNLVDIDVAPIRKFEFWGEQYLSNVVTVKSIVLLT